MGLQEDVDKNDCIVALLVLLPTMLAWILEGVTAGCAAVAAAPAPAPAAAIGSSSSNATLFIFGQAAIIKTSHTCLFKLSGFTY